MLETWHQSDFGQPVGPVSLGDPAVFESTAWQAL